MANRTQERILNEARRMVAGEKTSDFINDPRQFVRRLFTGYYYDRLVLFNRWLINDEQEQIDAYYGRK